MKAKEYADKLAQLWLDGKSSGTNESQEDFYAEADLLTKECTEIMRKRLPPENQAAKMPPKLFKAKYTHAWRESLVKWDAVANRLETLLPEDYESTLITRGSLLLTTIGEMAFSKDKTKRASAKFLLEVAESLGYGNTDLFLLYKKSFDKMEENIRQETLRKKLDLYAEIGDEINAGKTFDEIQSKYRDRIMELE